MFLPQEWADDRSAGCKTGVPSEVGHREKWRLALDMLDELAGWGLMPPVVVADAGYGRTQLSGRAGRARLDYVVAVRADVTAHPVDAVPTPRTATGDRLQAPAPLPRPGALGGSPGGRPGREAFTDGDLAAGPEGR